MTSLFDKGIVEVATVRACVVGSADRSRRRVQPGDLGGHVLIGVCGHVDTVTGGAFEDKMKESCILL